MLEPIFFICLICAIYTIYRVVGQSSRPKRQKFYIACFFLTMFMLPLVLRNRGSFVGDFYTLFVLAGYFCFMVVASFFCLIVVRDAIWLLLLIIEKVKKVSTPRFSWKKPAFVAKTNRWLFVLASAICVYALYAGLKTPDVKEQVVVSEKISQPVSIVVLGDMHINRTINVGKIRQIVAKTNALKPDVIVLPGDTVDDNVFFVSEALSELKELRAPQGIYATAGNHEFLNNYEQTKTAFMMNGINYLNNEGIALKGNVYLAGIPDLNKSPKGVSLPAAFSGSKVEDFKILVSHRPNVVYLNDYKGIDLTIAAHTHGGQFFPSHIITRLANGFLSGLYQLDNSLLYVTKGVGQRGPQMRFLAPSEIVHIKIQPVVKKAATKVKEANKVEEKKNTVLPEKTKSAENKVVSKETVELNKNDIVYPVQKKNEAEPFVQKVLNEKKQEDVVSRLQEAKTLADQEAIAAAQPVEDKTTQSDDELEEVKASIDSAFDNVLASKTQKDLLEEKKKTAQLEIELKQLRVDFEKTKRANEKVLIRQRSVIRYLEEERDALKEALADQKMILETERAETKEMLEAQKRVLLREQELSKQAFNLQKELMAELNLMKQELEAYRAAYRNAPVSNEFPALVEAKNVQEQTRIVAQPTRVVAPQNDRKQSPEQRKEERIANMEVIYHPNGGVTRQITKTVIVEYPTHFSTVKSVASYTTTPDEEARINPVSIENALRKSLGLNIVQ